MMAVTPKKKGKFNKQADNFFSDLRSFVTTIITHTTALDELTANQIANEIANRLADHWGGSMFYVTKHNAWQYHERDLAIWQAFNGNNHCELARRFELSVPYIYEIIARMRKKHHNTLQTDLFD